MKTDKQFLLPFTEAITLFALYCTGNYVRLLSPIRWETLPALPFLDFITGSEIQLPDCHKFWQTKGTQEQQEKFRQEFVVHLHAFQKKYHTAPTESILRILPDKKRDFEKYVKDYISKYMNGELEYLQETADYTKSLLATQEWLKKRNEELGNKLFITSEAFQKVPLPLSVRWPEVLLAYKIHLGGSQINILSAKNELNFPETNGNLLTKGYFVFQCELTGPLQDMSEVVAQYKELAFHRNGTFWFGDKQLAIKPISFTGIFLIKLIKAGKNHLHADEFGFELDPNKNSLKRMRAYAAEIYKACKKAQKTSKLNFKIHVKEYSSRSTKYGDIYIE